MGRIAISVDGRPLNMVGAWDGLKASWGWPYGSLMASWQMSARVRHPHLFTGALVVLSLGGVPIWRGFLLEPGRDGAMSAQGLYAEGNGALCLTSTGSTTSEPRDAVTQAIARGALRWPSLLPEIYPGAAAQQMDAPYPAQMVTALLDHVSEKNGTKWALDPIDGRLVVAANPTTPQWRVVTLAGAGLTPADDSTATHLIAEYIDAPGSRKMTPPVASPDYIAGAPRIEQHVDLIDKGFLTQTQATAYLTAMLGAGVGRVGWADNLTLARGDVLTMGGTTADLALVAASAATGTMLRLDGVWDERAPAADGGTNITAEEAEYDEDADTVTVKPVGKQARTIREVPLWL